MPPSEHDEELLRYLRGEREADRFRELENRVTKLETALEIEARDFSDTKRFRLTQAGVILPFDARQPSERPKRSDSIVPKAVKEVLRHKVTFILIGLYEVGRRLIELLLQHAK